LKCNKVKKLGVTKKEQILDAVIEAENFELNTEKTKLRRRDLKQLPEFEPKKKVKSIPSEEKKEENPYDNF
jgi:regulator of replication initiation timing